MKKYILLLNALIAQQTLSAHPLFKHTTRLAAPVAQAWNNKFGEHSVAAAGGAVVGGVIGYSVSHKENGFVAKTLTVTGGATIGALMAFKRKELFANITSISRDTKEILKNQENIKKQWYDFINQFSSFTQETKNSFSSLFSKVDRVETKIKSLEETLEQIKKGQEIIIQQTSKNTLSSIIKEWFPKK